ncbi:MAG: efflux RND transporter periplasmic adaptor subunit [Opitutales bacterium]
MKRFPLFVRISGLSVLVLLGFSLSGCGPRNAFAPPPPPPVNVAEAEVRDLTTFREFTGTLQANQTASLRARVSGNLEKQHFEAGTRVSTGDLLFEIEKDSFQAQVQSAQAALAQAQASFFNVNASFDRAKQLKENDAISGKNYVAAEAAYLAAKADVDAAKAGLAQAELNLSYTEIRAPFSGRIGRPSIDVGNLVGPDSGALTALVDDGFVEAAFSVSERILLPYLSEISTGDEANRVVNVFLLTADGAQYPLPGRLVFVDNRVNEETGTLRVRARFENPEGSLIPGLFARIRLPRENPDVLVVAEDALQRDITGYYLLLVGADNLVEKRTVELGPRAEGRVIITSGLEPGERYITQGLVSARPGAPVQVMPAQADS